MPDGGAHFRVWAPKRRKVEVEAESGAVVELRAEAGGYFSGFVDRAPDGARYRLRLDGAESAPDPASRFQPEGPHGPSEVVDAARFEWSDAAWRGLTLEGQVLYEMHIGAFTREGTWEAAGRELPELANLGITAIQMMPVADFPGRFGWGYDGVGLFAPAAIYGRPEHFRRFIDAAHGAGLGVILDVVYNHLGSEGNYLRLYSDDYFTTRYENEWGDAINFDGENSGPVREWAAANAAYWIAEYHLDGLRLDATPQIFDSSPEHVITTIARSARAAAGGRRILIIAESETQDARLAIPAERGGYGLDAVWNDDFHHAARVAATGRNEAYYSDYLGKPQELISAAKYGYLFQGQRYQWQSKRRGAPAWELSPAQFICYLDNHDQVANTGRGERMRQLTDAGRYRALTALLLLAPATPMLFQGQEFAASSPFLYFADHEPALRQTTREGRLQFLSQFPSLAQVEMRARHCDPGDAAAFERCKLDFRERQTHAAIYRMHRELIRLRREDLVFRRQQPRGLDGAVLAEEAFVLRFFEGPNGRSGNDRLLLVNLGRDLRLDPAPEPLLAPPEGSLWETLWSSEDPEYGGSGTPPLDGPSGWRMPGHAAVALRPCKGKNPWPT